MEVMPMSGRKADPKSPYRMREHLTNHYLYAATVHTEHKDGKRIRRYTHWGTLTSQKVFAPNLKFIMLSRSERNAFIFPTDWDVSSIKKLNEAPADAESDQPETVPPTNPDEISEPESESDAAEQEKKVKAGNSTPSPKGSQVPVPLKGYHDLLYGSVWFLLQIAELKHVVDDLMITFEYNSSVVNDILTLAIFPYLTRKNFDRLAHEQRITHYPSESILTSSYITYFTQHVTAQNRLDFCKLRIKRQPEGAYLACDSTTRSAWGKCIAEIHYGRNKDNRDMDCTLEVVVYSLTTHEPVYYRTFPGNEPDARTVRTIAEDMKHMGVQNLVTIYDRGYESADNFDEFFRDDLAFISCAKVAQEPVINCLMEVQYDAQGLPTNMEYAPEEKLFYGQFKIENRTYMAGDGTEATVSSDDFKCNVFLDPASRPFELIALNNRIKTEYEALKAKESKGQLASEKETINRSIRFHKVIFTETSTPGVFTAKIAEDEKAVAKARATCGFFSSVTYKAPGNALEMLRTYRTRDEQEKYFEQMKDQMDFHTQDCSSEDGKAGREFILFVGLILSSYVRNTWRHSAELREQFSTSLSVLDEMADIRWVRYDDGEEHITSFMQKQIDICKAYGITVPAECLPAAAKKAEERKTHPRKRGRKAKGTPAPNKITVTPC